MPNIWRKKDPERSVHVPLGMLGELKRSESQMHDGMVPLTDELR